MRNILIFTICIFSINANGQNSRKINFNISLGTCYSIPYTKKTYDQYRTSTDYKASFALYSEFITDYNIGNKQSLSLSIILYQSRFNINRLKESNGAFSTESGFIKTTNLMFPVIFKYKISDKIPITLGAGPYIGVILKAQDKGVNSYHQYISSSVVFVSDYNRNISNNYTSYDLGSVFILSYTVYNSKKTTLYFISKFIYGLTNVSDPYPIIGEEKSIWKNYNLLAGLGIKFRK